MELNTSHYTGHNKEIGRIGESLVERFLVNQGFLIRARNYWQKWGEIDIIAEKNDKLHFVEVKTVSHETKQALELAVTHGTWRPEEQVHREKLNRMARTIETYLGENQITKAWQIDVAAVRLVPRETYSTINYIENVIFT